MNNSIKISNLTLVSVRPEAEGTTNATIIIILGLAATNAQPLTPRDRFSAKIRRPSIFENFFSLRPSSYVTALLREELTIFYVSRNLHNDYRYRVIIFPTRNYSSENSRESSIDA